MFFRNYVYTLLLCISYFVSKSEPQLAKTSSIIGGYACKTHNNNISNFMIALTSFWGYPICGATLLSPSFILSAAHCNKYNLMYASRASDRDKNIGSNGLLGWWCPTKRIVDVYTHPGYSKITLQNDLAVMKLESPMDATDNDFVKLPPRMISGNILEKGLDYMNEMKYVARDNELPASCQTVTVVGWGTTSKTDYYVIPKNLMCVDLLLVPNDICRFILRKARARVGSGNMCAGGYLNKDSCVGDSGGPLLCDKYQYGITSWGPECAIGLPSVYTRVNKYINFIDNIVLRNEVVLFKCPNYLLGVGVISCIYVLKISLVNA